MRHGRHNSGVPAPIDLASVSDVQPLPEDDAAHEWRQTQGQRQ